MSQRHRPPVSVRPERTLARSGLWSTGPVQLRLPFEASGLSERISATGRLKVTPDFDVFAWLCERWQTRPSGSGWMKPTLYELGSALYSKAPSGENYRGLRASLDRLAWVQVTIDGYDVETSTFRENWVTHSSLMELGRAKSDPDGLQRPSVRLAEWLREALAAEKVVRVHWPTMRLFTENQPLAKRLWLYLEAERWRRGDAATEGTWIACGDRLYESLGMNYAQHRQARAALARACATVKRTDPRYAAATLEVVKLGSSWRVLAERPTWESWRAQRAEQAEVRALLQRELKYRAGGT